MQEKTIIPIEILRELLNSRGMILRQKQFITFEDGMQALRQIGGYMCPGFTIDRGNEFAYTNMLRWIINDEKMLCNGERGAAEGDLQKGIYIYGNVGTGKSLLLDIFRTFARYYKLRMKPGEALEPVPLAWMTWRADDICDQYAKDGDLSIWKQTRVLCIQDLGNEPAELLYMGNRRRVLRSIIEARGDSYDTLTLISSNIPPEKIGDIYGPRVASRISQMCNFLRMDGPDRRK